MSDDDNAKRAATGKGKVTGKGGKKSPKASSAKGREEEKKKKQKTPRASKKERRRKPRRTWQVYIYNVLKSLEKGRDQGIGISRAGMRVMDRIVDGLFDDIRLQSVRIINNVNRDTIGARDVEFAVRQVVQGELAKHAISEGTKSLQKYTSARPATKETKSPRSSPRSGGGKGKGKTTGTRKKGASRSVRAGVKFPVGRIHSKLKGRNRCQRASLGAAVFLAAVLEYLTAEILELSLNGTIEAQRKRVTPRFIALSVRNDEELNKLLPGDIAQGGVLPNIQRVLLPKSKKPSNK